LVYKDSGVGIATEISSLKLRVEAVRLIGAGCYPLYANRSEQFERELAQLQMP
jgi:hypothetical protein